MDMVGEDGFPLKLIVVWKDLLLNCTSGGPLEVEVVSTSLSLLFADGYPVTDVIPISSCLAKS